ncbi:MAG: OstA family protein [Chitinophagaceae bacterium]|nr:OstA family protein [Chitinophagaceae bacterium]
MKLLIHRFHFIACFLLFLLLAATDSVMAQVPSQDDVDRVEILNYTKRLTYQTIDDSTQLTIIAGNVKLRQGATIFTCDSCVLNNRTNIFEAWGRGGKVHINDSDTTNIYSSHLLYYMKTKQAFLDGGVRLTDGHATLTTPDLEYDMQTNIGIYKNGGKVINKKTTITSREGWYYADMKDIYFKKDVLLKDPAYTIVTDSLLVNSESQSTRFISMTTITDSSGRVIKTREGYYNQQTGKAEFGQRPIVIDGDTEVTGDVMQINDSTGISVVQGNAIIVDKKNKTTIIAGAIYRNKNTDAIMAVRKPLMIIQQDNDSIYISADTLFSARLTDLYGTTKPAGIGIATPDTTGAIDSVLATTDSGRVRIDTVIVPNTKRPPRRSSIGRDTVAEAEIAKIDSAAVVDSVGQPNVEVIDSSAILLPGGLNRARDSVMVHTTRGTQMVALNEKDSSNRYFEAYRNVRIYNDSLQAACDSLFYSFKDSVFRLYDDPVVWAKESQITGDTIHLFTRNKKADKIEAIENSLVVNRLTDQAFNQIKASRIDGFFIDGNIDSVRAKGYAECIYYIQDDDSAYTGINESKSDIMDVFFRNKELFKVVMRSAVTGTLWPIRQKSPSEMRLPNFKWLESRRPKSKLEMFE